MEGRGWVKRELEIGQQESTHMPQGAEVFCRAWIFIFAHQPFLTILGQACLCY